MRDIVDIFRRSERYQGLKASIAAGRSAQAEGLWGSSAAMMLAALAGDVERWLLVVTHSIDDAENLFDDLELFDPGRPWLFPPWERLPGDDAPPNAEVVSKRLTLLRRLLFEKPDAQAEPRVIVASVQALLQPVMSPQAMREGALRVEVGNADGPERITEWLLSHGFQSVPEVDAPGEVSRRGGILDVFPYSAPAPYRIEFFGDEIDSIRQFAVETQVSTEPVSEFHLIALPSSAADAATGAEGAAFHSLVSYLPEDAVLVFKEPYALRDRAERLSYGLEGLAAYLPFARVEQEAEVLTRLDASNLPFDEETNAFKFDVDTAGDYGTTPESAMVELRQVARRNVVTFVLCNNSAEQQRFGELWGGVSHQGLNPVDSRVGHINQGFQCRDVELAVVGYHEMFHRYRQRRQQRQPAEVRALDTFLDLQTHDYVVHAVHGIGRFLGIETLEQDGQRREFMSIEFANHAKLFVPASKVELVQKYVGGSDQRPALSVLGGGAWSKRKARAQAAVEDLASELLEIQTARRSKQGIAYPSDDEWQREFEAAFIYEETEDQLRAMEEISQDMCAPRPMDRLICGDVGYGKTELAMRAAFKAVNASKQVAVLVPTTILAEQHFTTFSERMADYPITIAMLSRFNTRSEQTATIEGLAEGKVDIVIGTHRLVQKDVKFRDLGLVIVDEEQRFGVKQKERLKKLRTTVDVLTLTATPIPRTLHMSLLGIRDISSLATPPQDRLSIQTRLWRFDREKIRQAILHELNRDGQVFFVHNRVHNIHRVADELRHIVPEARVVVAHGQMPERQLEQHMRDFIEHKTDVLVCTTIIESGVDIPNVNTLFINRADHFGLADLHQLRGRVGRYKHRAYAYLLLPPGQPVTPDAEKRLKAIEEFAELGAGFKIAMRDLEIRGAGNILGAEQHGHIASVGYDMYCRLLEGAVNKAKGEPAPEPRDVVLNLRLEAYLPDDYVPHVKQKIELYRRLNRCRSVEAIEATVKQIRDRFGPLPRPCQGLVLENTIRLLAEDAGLSSVSYTQSCFVITTDDPSAAMSALARERRLVRQVDERTLYLRFPSSHMEPEPAARLLRKTLQSRRRRGTIAAWS